MATPASIRLPDPLREQIRERARLERRSFSNTCRVLLEAGLSASGERREDVRDVDGDEVERLADVARKTIREAHGG